MAEAQCWLWADYSLFRLLGIERSSKNDTPDYEYEISRTEPVTNPETGEVIEPGIVEKLTYNFCIYTQFDVNTFAYYTRT